MVKEFLERRLDFIIPIGTGILVVLALILIHEYRFFSRNADALIAIQQQYRRYIDDVQKILDYHTQEQGLCGEWDDLEEPSFMPINRDPEYLKGSAIAYLKEQQLESLIAQMNMQEWQDYTDYFITNNSKQAALRSSKTMARATKKARVGRPRMPHGLQLENKGGLGIFQWPIEKKNFWLSSFFGPRKKASGVWKFHYGIDMAAPRGTPVRSAGDGVVVEARHDSGYGNTVLVKHSSVYKTRYAHLNTIAVKVGQEVKTGSYIGQVGATGFIMKSGKDGSHLHFEVYDHGKQVNPLRLLPER